VASLDQPGQTWPDVYNNVSQLLLTMQMVCNDLLYGADPDEGFGDSCRRRRCLLPDLVSVDFDNQRGKRSAVDTTVGADDIAEYPRHEDPQRDSDGPRLDQQYDAGRCRRTKLSMLYVKLIIRFKTVLLFRAERSVCL